MWRCGLGWRSRICNRGRCRLHLEGAGMGLEHVSMAQAVGIWSDLVEAYHGVNGYGGRVAEMLHLFSA